MWIYEKRLQYPVKITKTCPKTAQLIISQYGGPDGEFPFRSCQIWKTQHVREEKMVYAMEKL